MMHVCKAAPAPRMRARTRLAQRAQCEVWHVALAAQRLAHQVAQQQHTRLQVARALLRKHANDGIHAGSAARVHTCC